MAPKPTVPRASTPTHANATAHRRLRREAFGRGARGVDACMVRTSRDRRLPSPVLRRSRPDGFPVEYGAGQFEATRTRNDSRSACHHSAKRSWNVANGMPWRAACSTGMVSQPKCSTVTRVSVPSTRSARAARSPGRRRSWRGASEDQPRRRVPDADVADDEHAAVGVRLDQPSVGAGLEAQRAGAALGELEQPVRPPPPRDLAVNAANARSGVASTRSATRRATS